MRASIIAGRYALALLGLGIERKNFEQLGRELDRVVSMYKCDDLRELFQNPKFGVESRKAVLADLLRRVMVSPISRNFLFLLVERNRIGLLPDIVEAYHNLADDSAGRVRARVTVARRLGEPDVARLRTVLEKVTGKQVVVEQEEDPSIIGGIITRIGDRIYDGSVQAQLSRLRTQLKNAR